MNDYEDMRMAEKIIQSLRNAQELRRIGIESCELPPVTYTGHQPTIKPIGDESTNE